MFRALATEGIPMINVNRKGPYRLSRKAEQQWHDGLVEIDDGKAAEEIGIGGMKCSPYLTFWVQMASHIDVPNYELIYHSHKHPNSALPV